MNDFIKKYYWLKDMAQKEGDIKQQIKEEIKTLLNYRKPCDCSCPESYYMQIGDTLALQSVCLRCGGGEIQYD